MSPFVFALLTKLTIILALGITIAALLRSASPSLRHLVLFATLSAGLALPVVMALSPEWRVPLLPPRARAEASPGGAAAPAVVNRTIPPTDLRTDVSRTSSMRVPRFETGYRRIALLPLLWIVGVISVLAWLVIGRVRLGHIAWSSWPLEGGDWASVLNEERRDAGVTVPIRLCSSPAVSTPLTWGSRAPVILLPEDAVDWPDEHRRVVLRHELAHIARRDSFAQLLAGIGCALYWFHPLVWVAERRLRAECERACDDRVVSLGTPAADYAAHLLEVARSARAFGAAGFLSVAMARPSQLEGRLLAVLSESRRRAALSATTRRSAAILSALILVPLAAFRAVPRSSEEIPSGSQRPESEVKSADSTFQLSVPARSGGSLTLDLKTGGSVSIVGWDRPEVMVDVSLGGRNWRDTRVTLDAAGDGARLASEFAGRPMNPSTGHSFEIKVPRKFDVRLESSGGAIAIAGVDGRFTGETGGGAIDIHQANGDVSMRTGGGDVRVSNGRINGTVSTGGGVVRIQDVTGNLTGRSGSGPVTVRKKTGSVFPEGYSSDAVTTENTVNVVQHHDDYRSGFSIHAGSGGGGGSGSGSGTFPEGRVSASWSSSGSGSGVTNTATYVTDGDGKKTVASSGIVMSSSGGPISLPSAPDGATVETAGGEIRIGPSGGRVYASTGGGRIDIAPATGSVEAHTGAGDVAIELQGTNAHSVNVTSGSGNIDLLLPSDLNATLELETAYTENFGRKTRIVSDWPVTTTETSNWDATEGTPRRYVRVRQNIGRGGAVIRVRTVNGNIILHRA